MGNILTKYPVKKIEKRQEGISTLASRKIWYDDTVKRINGEERGQFLGDFSGSDRILTMMQTGHYRLTSFDLSTHFDEDLILIEKFDPEKIFSVIYQDAASKSFYIKRFKVEPTDRKVDFIGDEEKNKLAELIKDKYPRIEVQFDMKIKTKGNETEEINVHEFIGVKSFKAKGKRMTVHPVKKISVLEPLQIEEPVIEELVIEEPVTEDPDTEIKIEDKKSDETGDAVQMELPL
jgi:topoisomerase-4 subunit A